ncbi:hypothetical protein PCANC_08498 [Puccinia coronata f. sp. avenae]|uniref:FAR1 domain-containing protein n=1 Tax=Puccinia coronata f. sp. avenae TaxID=200324 RepID=A0A2N5T4B2_9BASI|nr:hypothetical protein PCANC_08498 [Puccinia coronata f. sp. avenae]
MAMQLGGTPAANRRKGNTQLPTVSRLINCPFRATAYFQKKKDHWKFTVTNPAHNHASSLNPSAHTANRQLTASLFEEQKKLGDAGLRPSVILQALKKSHPEETILATITTIYSARKKASQELLQGISPIVHVQKTLQASDFTTTPQCEFENAMALARSRSQKGVCANSSALQSAAEADQCWQSVVMTQ